MTYKRFNFSLIVLESLSVFEAEFQLLLLKDRTVTVPALMHIINKKVHYLPYRLVMLNLLMSMDLYLSILLIYDRRWYR
jgi:hypothetical protein